jgi:hypothetical protein
LRGETSRVVIAALGHTDPALALSIYAHAMRRDGKNERLRALVAGAPIGSNGSGVEFEAAADSVGNVR